MQCFAHNIAYFLLKKTKRLDFLGKFSQKHMVVMNTKINHLQGIIAGVLICVFTGCVSEEKADILLRNGLIYTVNEEKPLAQAVAITGNKITGVFENDQEAETIIGVNTRVIDLKGMFVTPGIIDGHVHFNSAGALINDANLLTVSDESGLRAEIKRVVDILDDGEWITEGLWGAYEQWALGDAGDGRRNGSALWRPHRNMIDDISASNPVFLCRFDRREWLANKVALQAAGLYEAAVEGMELDEYGNPTGIVYINTPAYETLRASVEPKSHERLMNENRAALQALRESGITEIHDIATPGQVARFIELDKNNELTARVWLRPDLSRGAELKEKGISMGLHPGSFHECNYLRYGALKGYIDGIMGTHGALFFEPYHDQPGNYGHWRHHTSDCPELKEGNMEKMYALIKEGLEAGFVPNIHAIGDRGVAEMLDLYERLKEEGIDLTGFRVIHAQVVRPQDFERFSNLNVIAEVNPYHISDDMRWMEERIGYERCKGAYAFRSLLDNGAILSFGSDWPGTSAAQYHVHPRYTIYAAVSRKTIEGKPEDGWFPEERISVEEAIKAYTLNNAYATFDDDIRGSVEVGKLADLTVFDRNLLDIPHREILETQVVMTIVNGKVVYERD